MTTSAPGTREGGLHSSWLVARRPGGRTGDVAEELCRALRRRDVLFLSTTQDRIATCPTYCYAYVVIVLDGPAGDLAPIVDAVDTYRVRRPRGWTSAGTVEPTQAGIVQVIAPVAVLSALRAGDAARHICAMHDIGAWSVDDVFGPVSAFETEALGSGAGSVADISLERLDLLWLRIQGLWNLPEDIRCIPRVLETIRCCRHRYEDPNQPAMHRPLPGDPRNRFDLILDPPERGAVADRAWKSFQENGAKIVRECVLPALRTRFPDICPPNRGKRDAQKHLKDLVEALELLLAHPSVGPPN